MFERYDDERFSFKCLARVSPEGFLQGRPYIVKVFLFYLNRAGFVNEQQEK